MDEALPQLLDNFLSGIFLIEQLNELSRSNLSLLNDALLILNDAGLMVVNERVVLPNFAHHVINLFITCDAEEGLLNVEVFFLYVSRQGQVIVGFICNK